MLTEKPDENSVPYHKRVVTYECQACGKHCYDVIKRLKKPSKRKCPFCSKMALESVLEPTIGFVKQDAQTVGQLAERNTKKMGRYELEAKRQELESNAHRVRKTDRNQFKEKMSKEGYEVLEKQDSPLFGKDFEKRDRIANMSMEDKISYAKGEIDA
jgi:Fe-S-cluster-containing dehydrogenase component